MTPSFIMKNLHRRPSDSDDQDDAGNVVLTRVKSKQNQDDTKMMPPKNKFRTESSTDQDDARMMAVPQG